MKTAIRCVVMVFAIGLVACQALAQELVPTPEPSGAAKVEADAGAKAAAHAHSIPMPSAPTDLAANRWRYRWANGHWWYWTPQNRWMWYNDEGKWVDFDRNSAPLVVAQADNVPVYPSPYYPRYDYEYGAYYPGYGYWRGYYPGVAVGVWPYGNVGVNVGRRIAVGVEGPHGAVRVGRIYVGW
jgi:hypothetical protein